MLNAVLFIAATTFAQAGPTVSVFGEMEEAIVYRYQAEVEQKGAISVVPSAASFEAFVDYEKAAHAKDHGRCDEMEKRGQIYWIESGTRCHSRSWGMSVGPVIRAGQEVRNLEREAQRQDRLDPHKVPSEIRANQDRAAGALHG